MPGSDGPLNNIDEAKKFVKQYGLPIIIKAAHGGGDAFMQMQLVEQQVRFAFQPHHNTADTFAGNL